MFDKPHLSQRRLHVETVALQTVLCRNPLPLSVVFLPIFLRLGHHPFDILPAEPALVVRDLDPVVDARRLVCGGHAEDPVRVNVESHLDLGRAARGGLEAGQLEFAQQVVVTCHGALTLEHLTTRRFYETDPISMNFLPRNLKLYETLILLCFWVFVE